MHIRREVAGDLPLSLANGLPVNDDGGTLTDHGVPSPYPERADEVSSAFT